MSETANASTPVVAAEKTEKPSNGRGAFTGKDYKTACDRFDLYTKQLGFILGVNTTSAYRWADSEDGAVKTRQIAASIMPLVKERLAVAPEETSTRVGVEIKTHLKNRDPIKGRVMALKALLDFALGA